MDVGAGGRGPYGAVAALTRWAASDWTYLWGSELRGGLDLDELARKRGAAPRFFAVLYSQLIDRLQWAEKEDRAEVMAILQWPDVAKRTAIEEQDRQAQEAMARLGIVIDTSAFDAVHAEPEQTGHNEPVPNEDDVS